MKKTLIVIGIIALVGLAVWGYTLKQAPACGCGG